MTAGYDLAGMNVESFSTLDSASCSWLSVRSGVGLARPPSEFGYAPEHSMHRSSMLIDVFAGRFRL
ncbi:hypothetical protein OE88DRAFT_1659451, partial [Heliocybe sulcata]